MRMRHKINLNCGTACFNSEFSFSSTGGHIKAKIPSVLNIAGRNRWNHTFLKIKFELKTQIPFSTIRIRVLYDVWKYSINWNYLKYHKCIVYIIILRNKRWKKKKKIKTNIFEFHDTKTQVRFFTYRSRNPFVLHYKTINHYDRILSLILN